jgi:hypothetical protein
MERQTRQGQPIFAGTWNWRLTGLRRKPQFERVRAMENLGAAPDAPWRRAPRTAHRGAGGADRWRALSKRPRQPWRIALGRTVQARDRLGRRGRGRTCKPKPSYRAPSCARRARDILLLHGQLQHILLVEGTRPGVGISNRRESRRSVVLPDPEGPSSATSSPGSISRRPHVAPASRRRF